MIINFNLFQLSVFRILIVLYSAGKFISNFLLHSYILHEITTTFEDNDIFHSRTMDTNFLHSGTDFQFTYETSTAIWWAEKTFRIFIRQMSLRIAGHSVYECVFTSNLFCRRIFIHCLLQISLSIFRHLCWFYCSRVREWTYCYQKA